MDEFQVFGVWQKCIHYRSQMKLCLSVHRGKGEGSAMMSLPIRDSTSPLDSTSPSTVEKRAVRILLEGFLVQNCDGFVVNT